MAAPTKASGPEVTVLLPVRNGAATLEAAAVSILRQSFSNLELLIVDDGSTDATPAVVAALATQDERVRPIRQDALGLVAALNRGIREAHTPLIARMDADAVSAPTRLARQVAIMADSPQTALIGTGWREMSAAGAIRRVVAPPATDAGLRAIMADANGLAHPTVMMRRDVVVRAGLYRPAFLFAEDYDLWLRLMDRHSAACIPEPLLDRREHHANATWRELEQRILSEMAAVAAHDRRQVGRPDRGEEPQPIDRARLRAMGMLDGEIADGVVTRALGAALDAAAAGQSRTMRQAAALGWRQPGLDRKTRLRFATLWLQALAPNPTRPNPTRPITERMRRSPGSSPAHLPPDPPDAPKPRPPRRENLPRP